MRRATAKYFLPLASSLNALAFRTISARSAKNITANFGALLLNLDDAYTNVPVYDEQGNQVLDAQGNPVYERKNLLFTGKFHGDIWGGMALSMGLMGAGKYSISGIAYGNMKHQVNVADRVAAEIFTPERWEPIREIIDNTTNDDIGTLAESMVNDPNLSDEERAAVMEYMERSLNLRGLNLGAMAQSRGAEDEEGVELPTPVELDMDNEFSQSYIDGYEASSPQEMADAQNMYEYQRQRAEGMFEPSVLESLDGNPVATLMDMSQTGLYSQEEIDAARDYINAKTVRDGILQRVNDNVASDPLVGAQMISWYDWNGPTSVGVNRLVLCTEKQGLYLNPNTFVIVSAIDFDDVTPGFKAERLILDATSPVAWNSSDKRHVKMNSKYMFGLEDSEWKTFDFDFISSNTYMSGLNQTTDNYFVKRDPLALYSKALDMATWEYSWVNSSNSATRMISL